MAAAAAKNGSAAAPTGSGEYDYDLLIIGCGVGGHGAALHAVECVSAGALPTGARPVQMCQLAASLLRQL